ncbi:hypothetical protein [Xenorhabdus bovienii]|uniref:hypothetical protein n=1 Tax=Xenorhabdus bovienii TaxID=40576 RepID=UPI000A58B556|nr:hypothetical protein [Xenorhabdus bovienii]
MATAACFTSLKRGAGALAIMIVLFGNVVLMLNQTHSIPNRFQVAANKAAT